MKPRDFEGGDSGAIERFERELAEWERRRNELAAAHAAAAGELVAAQGRLSVLTGWVDRLGRAVATTGANAAAVGRHTADLAAASAALADLEPAIADHDEARRTATGRLLGDVDAGLPLTLLPLRLQTRWDGASLDVRIYPDILTVDVHDPELSAEEARWGAHYWQVRGGTVAGDEEQTWQQLADRFGPERGAWIAAASNPAGPGAKQRTMPWPRAALARLLPARFAVVAFAGGEPVNVAPAGAPPQFVTWSGAVKDPLECGAVVDGDGSAWLTDLAAARAAGMAVGLTPAPGSPPIDVLAAVGVRAPGGPPVADGLAELLRAHAFSDGVELLADGTATNNSAELRAGYTPDRREASARVLLDSVLGGGPAGPPGPGTAGRQLAQLLGLGDGAVSAIAGSAVQRAAPEDASKLLVRLAARGALLDRLGPAAPGAWPLVAPAGPGPALRVGRQPYGLLPATAPRRWAPRPGEATAGLAPILRRWGEAVGPVTGTDPGDPPVRLGGGDARRATPDDDRRLPALLVESSASLRWLRPGGARFEGLDATVGAADGPHGTRTVLELLAATPKAQLDGVARALPPTLLTTVAVAAKRTAAAPDVAAVDGALRTLATVPRADLARRLAAHLDAVSHRFDAWITAPATERLGEARRRSAQGAVGAFGWLTDVAPRKRDRSHGHVHAPSLGHAASAAVLRSAFLGERQRAWTERVEETGRAAVEARARLAEVDAALAATPRSDPQWRVVAALRQRTAGEAEARERAAAGARSGRLGLTPLDAQAERRLPMAVDLSSRRVRGALWVLGAVRNGQPLGAVLGQQFERDLADAGLQHYLAAFRKLTRFRTGTALEGLEDARRARRDALAAAAARLTALQGAAEALRALAQAAAEEESRARAAADVKAAAAAPFVALRNELDALPATIARLQGELAAIDARKPAARERHFTIKVP